MTEIEAVDMGYTPEFPLKKENSAKNAESSKTNKSQKDYSTLSIADKIREVNAVLKSGEPGNINVERKYGTKEYTGYAPQYIIDAMNLVMFGEWGFEEVSNIFTNKDEEGKPKLAVACVRVWLEGINFQPTAYGQSNVTTGDYGDAQKGAQTDAIKKALSYFSVGNRAYHGKLEK